MSFVSFGLFPPLLYSAFYIVLHANSGANLMQSITCSWSSIIEIM
jgi:hypothetical protein